jgi:hypothetical protein
LQAATTPEEKDLTGRSLKRIANTLMGKDDGEDGLSYQVFKSSQVVITKETDRFVVSKRYRRNGRGLFPPYEFNSLEAALSGVSNCIASGNLAGAKIHCTYCLDDRSVTVCSFCGCTVSYLSY